MKTMKFLVSAVVLGVVSVAATLQAQEMSGQPGAQESASTSASPDTSTNASGGMSGYGGVSGTTSLSGSMARPGRANCGHLPQCSPDSGH